MKLGIFLVIIGSLIMFWFAVLPVVLIMATWSINWGALAQSLAIALFCGGIPFTIGQDRVKQFRTQKGEHSKENETFNTKAL